jgi:hypothetical protein
MVREIVENRSARGANITFPAENAALEPIILMKNDWLGEGFEAQIAGLDRGSA